MRQLEFNEFKRRHHVSQLKKLVSIRRYGLCKIHNKAGARLDRRKQDVRNWRLSAIVINLDAVIFRMRHGKIVKERGQVPIEPFDQLLFRIDKSFLYNKAMIIEIELMSEGQHTPKDLNAKRPI